MNSYKGVAPLTSELIEKYNSLASNGPICISFKNTKGLTSESVSKLDKSITIQIIGGLDKKKYSNKYYIGRTLYTTKELTAILEKFEAIEKNINPLWSEKEKAMLVYKALGDYLIYDEYFVNGKDASRSLLGMITGKSVCAGISLIFKEMMDRLGIWCEYQNRQRHHSWNVVKLDGAMYGLDLTWDIYDKEDGVGDFHYFCREGTQKFYGNEHRDLSRESEERQYTLGTLSHDELVPMYNKISQRPVKRVSPRMVGGRKALVVGDQKIIIVDGRPFYVGNEQMTYIRNDLSTFVLIPTFVHEKGVYEFIYVDYYKDVDKFYCARIYSDIDLIQSEEEYRKKIANNLLSQSRVIKKVKNFNGYVGYVLPDKHGRFYNPDFEENVMNVYR